MRAFKKLLQPEIYLRLGLGATFLYSGYDIYSNPNDWIGFLLSAPEWVHSFIEFVGLSPEQFLLTQGVAEMALGAIVLAWFLPTWLSKIALVVLAAELALILWLVGIDAATFRDIGLLGAVLALLVIVYRR